MMRGYDVLHDSALNKSTAFSREERESLGLRGLLPARIGTIEVQQQRVLENLHRKASDIERYIFLCALQDRNERLFYRTVIDNIEEMMPLIYTPTVGQACKEFGHIFRRPRGLYITPDDRGEIRRILDNWPEQDVRVIVVTDGERILGLGDLGANGMGIPIGKLSLYVAGAGIHPNQCLPIMLDVGTNNEELLNDPLYLGYPAHRLAGQLYDDLVEEFVLAIQDKFPDVLLQFEDFLRPNAYKLLNKYRKRILCFNDDIQGTAAVTLAGLYATTHVLGKELQDSKIMFLGAGSAATGIAELLVTALVEKGLDDKEARRKLWFVDSKGLIVASRDDLPEHKLPYAHDHPATDFIGAIRNIKPHILIGTTGTPGSFTQEAIRLMAEINQRPSIFALSNPTSKAECTAEQAYLWSSGRAIFASGSPFAPVTYGGLLFRPSQCNNAYVFPGFGLGVIASKARSIPDELFLVAAKALAGLVKESDLNSGALYPPLTDIRAVSLQIATQVAGKVKDLNLANASMPNDIEAYIASQMYIPTY